MLFDRDDDLDMCDAVPVRDIVHDHTISYRNCLIADQAAYDRLRAIKYLRPMQLYTDVK